MIRDEFQGAADLGFRDIGICNEDLSSAATHRWCMLERWRLIFNFKVHTQYLFTRSKILKFSTGSPALHAPYTPKSATF